MGVRDWQSTSEEKEGEEDDENELLAVVVKGEGGGGGQIINGGGPAWSVWGPEAGSHHPQVKKPTEKWSVNLIWVNKHQNTFGAKLVLGLEIVLMLSMDE